MSIAVLDEPIPTTAVLDEPIPTLADLLAALGDVPMNRVLMKPAPGTATESDVLRLIAQDKICELIDGTLVEKPMGWRESILAIGLAGRLRDFVKPNRLGVVSGEAGTLRMLGGNVRIPDVAFVSWDQLPGRRIPDEPIPGLSPALAVEVLSVSNTRREMRRKREEYFASGTRLVWEIDPEDRTIRVFTGVDESALLTVADLLDGGTVLPGFHMPVREVFAELDDHG